MTCQALPVLAKPSGWCSDAHHSLLVDALGAEANQGTAVLGTLDGCLLFELLLGSKVSLQRPQIFQLCVGCLSEQFSLSQRADIRPLHRLPLGLGLHRQEQDSCECSDGRKQCAKMHVAEGFRGSRLHPQADHIVFGRLRWLAVDQLLKSKN